MIADIPSLAGASWLCSPHTQAVLGCIIGRGFGARVVGGAVRDALLGLDVSDIDIATNATPHDTIAAASAAGLKTVATGLAHGTVTVISGGKPYEVTTLRRDIESDGRHATVAFTDDWTADASRRDFSINALYCDPDGVVFDPLGGFVDLQNRRVRFIGDARQRIREDYLRILRFFRFTAMYGDGAPDQTGIGACVAERAGLPSLSAERVQSELFKLAAAPRATSVMEAMAGHGLLTMVLPFAPRLDAFGRICAIEEAAGRSPIAALRIAALTIAVAEDVDRLAAKLRLAGHDRTLIASAISGLPLSPALTDSDQRRELYWRGSQAFESRVMMDWSLSGDPPSSPEWLKLLELPRRWQPPALPFSGRDLIERGLTPGPSLGHILRAFETWWVASDFPSRQPVLKAGLERCIADSGTTG